MNFNELNRLDLNNLGNWPTSAKALLIGACCLMVFGLGYWLDTQGQIEDLDRLKQKEDEYKQTFARKQAKAANLDAYKLQMQEIEASFGIMLRQLPGRTEVADLLVDISQSGLASGLEFELFKPQAEVPKEFYAELPIKIRVRGRYHEFGHFVSRVASLPRIVTLHDFSIDSAKQRPGELVMELTAKTYRYLDENEQQAAQDQGKPS